MLAVFCAVPATASALLREQVVALQGTELQLAHSGRAVFADLIFPDTATAESWLSQHVLQHELTFEPVGEDRYGRLLIRSDAETAMLHDGVGFAFSNKPISREMLTAEATAHQAKRGIWASTALCVTPENAAEHLQQFVIVEGIITHLYKGRSGTYLNFGADWKTDFSIGIAKRYQRSFPLLDTLKEGSHVRVRGVVIEENGPMIQITRPEQLELL